MTSLQQQLAVIAANSTKQLDIKAQRSAHGKSLLFESKVAVTQNFDVLYQICREGFDDLCALDPRFAMFGNTLFSEQSKSEEREQMTAAQNKDLDIAINSFLDLVAPKLLLKPGQKATEWLVRRFRAHEFNTEQILLSFLPYHSTPLFLNLVAILPARLPPSLKFLKPYAASLMNPPLHAIVYSATNNPSFFIALNRQIIGAAKARFVSSETVRFWTVLVSQAIDGMLTAAQSGIMTIRKERTESVLLQILPVLDEIFAVQGSPDLEVGACMIITIIAARGDVSDNVKARFMEAISASWNPTTIDARLVCLVALTQDAVPKRLPKKVAKKLLSTDDLVERLTTISASYRSANLVAATFNYCVSRLDKPDCSQEIGFVCRSLQDGLLESRGSHKALQTLVSKIASLSAEEANALHISDSAMGQLLNLFKNQTKSHLGTTLQGLPNKSELVALERIFQIQILPEVDSGDEMEVDQSIVNVIHEPAIDLDLSELAGLDTPTGSFVATMDSSVVFNKLANLFSLALKQSKLDTLLDHPYFKRSAAVDGDSLYASFLIRLTCSGNQSPKVRSQAMGLLAKLVSKIRDAGLDPQLLAPYIILGLQDHSQHVRKAASQALIECPKAGGALSKLWGATSLYNSMEVTLIRLAHEQLNVLLTETLIPCLEEFNNDQFAVSQILKTFFMTKEKLAVKKSTKSEQLESKRTKAAICDFFAHHVALTSILGPKIQILELLNQFGKSAITARSTFGLQALKQWVDQSEKEVKHICSSQDVTLPETNLALVQAIVPTSSDGLEYLNTLVSGPSGRFDIVQPSQQRLTQIWSDIPTDKRISFLNHLVEMSLKDPKAGQKLRDASNETLRSLPFEIEDLVNLLESLPETSSLASSPAIKRKRLSSGQSSEVERIPKQTLEALRRYTRVLEIVESSNSPTGPHQAILLKSLFHVLSELQNFGIQTDSSMVYLKTLTMNSLLAVVNKLKDTKHYPEQLSTIRTDLVVDTIGNTPNIQLQQACLLLISGLATWVPEVVLHSVMPIFTLMGSTVLRQSDDYSAHVIDQTVSQVVPPLVASLKARSKEVLSGLADILLSFAAAFEHIPSHRRLSLYTHIVEALGAEECLFAVVCMIRYRYPTDFSAREFAAELTNSFSPQLALNMVLQSVELAADVFKNRRTISETLLHIKDMNDAECHIVGDILLYTISDLLKYPKLKAKIAASMHFEAEKSELQQSRFSKLMGLSIQVVQRLQDTPCQIAANEMLGNVFGLLPLEDLIACAQMLLEGASDDVRKVVVNAVADKVQGFKQISNEGSTALLSFLPTLDKMLDQVYHYDEKKSVIECCIRITEKVGKKDPSALVAVVSRVAGPHCLGSGHLPMQMQSLLAVALLVRIIKEELLPLIPSLLTKSFDLLQKDLVNDDGNLELHEAIFTVINAIGHTVPFALAGDFLDQGLRLAQRSSAQLDEPVIARSAFYEAIATRVNATEAFSAIERNFYWVEKDQDFDSIVEYYKLAKSAVMTHTKSEVLKNSSTLFKFIKEALGLRAVKIAEGSGSVLTASDIEELELLIIDITLSVVMKMNDATFRPFFIQLVDWASFKQKKPSAAQVAKATTLFHLLQALLHRLRGLMTSYVSYLLEFSAFVMTLTTEEELLTSALLCLRQSFECDEDEYWQSPTHFTTIKAPLLHLLSVESGIPDQLIAAVTAFASAANSADHFKTMNADILSLFRSTSAATRLTAVRCQRSLTDVLGEDWLVHLPEMLPLITELLEDDDEKVERETRLWIKNVEDIVGENLDSMLQ